MDQIYSRLALELVLKISFNFNSHSIDLHLPIISPPHPLGWIERLQDSHLPLFISLRPQVGIVTRQSL